MAKTARQSRVSAPDEIIIKPRAPYETAQIFCQHRAGQANKALVRYRSTWYLWTGTHYRKLDTETVRAELWAFLDQVLAWEKQTSTTEDGQTKEEFVKRQFRPEPVDVTKLYDALLALSGSPVVAINRAVALAESKGPSAGLQALGEVAQDSRIAQYQPYWAARADLLARTGQPEKARDAYELAIGLERDPAVRQFLQMRLQKLA